MKRLLAFWFFLLAAFAQVETTTSITGTVADPVGAVFPGAIVKLTNQNTGATRQTATSSEGVYSFQSLPAGRYTIVISASGFKTTTITDRVIETAQPAHVDIKLELGSTSEQVTDFGGFTSFPEFSPDGKTLVFCSDRNAKQRYEFNIFTADWK